MRKLIFSTLLAIGVIGAVNAVDVSGLQTGSMVTAAIAQDQAAAPAERDTNVKADVNVNTGTPRTVETRETTLFVDPVWIALAVGAIILIGILFAAGSRGGGTTIVKD